MALQFVYILYIGDVSRIDNIFIDEYARLLIVYAVSALYARQSVEHIIQRKIAADKLVIKRIRQIQNDKILL